LAKPSASLSPSSIGYPPPTGIISSIVEEIFLIHVLGHGEETRLKKRGLNSN